MRTKGYRNKQGKVKRITVTSDNINNQKDETVDCCIAVGRLKYTTSVQVGEMG